MNISQGFEVRPAANGGFVVTRSAGPGYASDLIGAFTNAVDMFGWLGKEHGLDVALFRRREDVSPTGDDPAAQAVVEAYRNTDREQIAAVTNDVPSVQRYIKWDGGDCPVDPETPVEVEFRGGAKEHRFTAGTYRWSHHRTVFDIMRYRVIK